MTYQVAQERVSNPPLVSGHPQNTQGRVSSPHLATLERVPSPQTTRPPQLRQGQNNSLKKIKFNKELNFYPEHSYLLLALAPGPRRSRRLHS